jgi:hypothetical protein
MVVGLQIGNCVGKGNHRMFLLWAATQLAAEVLMLFLMSEGVAVGD